MDGLGNNANVKGDWLNQWLDRLAVTGTLPANSTRLFTLAFLVCFRLLLS